MPAMLLLSLAACRPDPSAETGVVDDDPQFLALLDWTEARMDEWDVPGAAVAVVQGDELHLAGLGVRQWGTDDPVTPDTLFRAGSLSKMITGILAAKAVDEGRLDLDAPASDYIGDLELLAPHSFADMTLLQLLSHTSGMQTTGLPLTCDTDPSHLAQTFAELTPEWALWTPPGELYNYSNQNFGLAGLAVERAGDEVFPDQAQALFDAAGMGTATYDWTVAQAEDHATGHTMDPNSDQPLYFRGLDERACVASYPSGGMIASARDLGHLAQFLLGEGEGFLTPGGWEILTTQGYARTETSGYGFGLQNTDYRGYPGMDHHGSVGGYLAMIYVIPSERLGVAVMVNADHHVTDPWEPWSRITERIMEHALDGYLGLEPEERESSALPVEEWGRFAGTWHSDYDLGDVTLTYDGETLTYSAEGEEHELLPYSSSSFQYAVAKDDGRTSYTGVSFRSADDEGHYQWVVTDSGIAGATAEE